MDKITLLSPNANNFSFSQNDRQNKDFAENFQKDSKDSQNSKQNQAFLDILHDEINTTKEINNDNAISSTTNQWQNEATRNREANRGNPYSNFGTPSRSPTMAFKGYGNSSKILRQQGSIDYYSGGNSEESRSSGLDTGSERIARLRDAKAYTTAEERNRLDRLEKLEKAFKAQQSIRVYKEHTKLHKQHKNSHSFEMGGFV